MGGGRKQERSQGGGRIRKTFTKKNDASILFFLPILGGIWAGSPKKKRFQGGGSWTNIFIINKC